METVFLAGAYVQELEFELDMSKQDLAQERMVEQDVLQLEVNHHRRDIENYLSKSWCQSEGTRYRSKRCELQHPC